VLVSEICVSQRLSCSGTQILDLFAFRRHLKLFIRFLYETGSVYRVSIATCRVFWINCTLCIHTTRDCRHYSAITSRIQATYLTVSLSLSITHEVFFAPSNSLFCPYSATVNPEDLTPFSSSAPKLIPAGSCLEARHSTSDSTTLLLLLRPYFLFVCLSVWGGPESLGIFVSSP
jgi:hypothetical protein